jgi:hypothetical protein
VKWFNTTDLGSVSSEGAENAGSSPAGPTSRGWPSMVEGGGLKPHSTEGGTVGSNPAPRTSERFIT